MSERDLLPALRVLFERIADHEGHHGIEHCVEDMVAAARAGIVLIDREGEAS